MYAIIADQKVFIRTWTKRKGIGDLVDLGAFKTPIFSSGLSLSPHLHDDDI